MKKWNLIVDSSVEEISRKLTSRFGSASGFVFSFDHDLQTFKVHKRGLYAFYLMFLNKINVKGRILKTTTANETNIEISFTQYFLWKLIIAAHLFLGLGFLGAIISKASTTIFMYLLAAIVIAIGIILWITVQNKFKKDVQEYKTLLSEILS